MTDSIVTTASACVETRFPTLARAWGSRVALDAAEYSLTDAIEHCRNGEPVAAGELLGEILMHFRQVVAAEHFEFEAMEHLPPLWKVDVELDARRNAVLEQFRREADGTGVFDAEGGYLVERDGEFILYVRANDSWAARQDGFARMIGAGLTTLVAFWRGEDLPTTVARLARKFGLGGNS